MARGGAPAVHSSLTTTASDAPLASVTDTRANPAPSGFQADCRRRSASRDRLAVDEPGRRRNPAERLQREFALPRAILEAEIDASAVGRKGDLERRRLGCGHGLRRVLAQMAERRRQVGADRRAQHALRRLDDFDVAAQPLESVEQDRRRDLTADEAGRRAVVGPADPDRDRRSAIEADRQRVAEAVGRAGLEGDAPAQSIGRRRRATQNVGDVPGGDRIGDAPRPDRRRRAPVEPLDQRRRLAAAGDPRVEARDVGQRHAEAAKSDCEADRRLLRQRDVGPGAVQPRQKGRRPDVGQKFDRRQIERHLQRLARGHRALVAEVEILRRISAVAHRPVEQHRLGMREAFLEGERVNERLQRRARRAGRTRHVDRAVARGVVEIGGADAGADLAGSIVDRDNGRREFGAEARDGVPGERFELRLQPRVDGEADRLRLFVRSDRLLRRMGGKLGKGLARLQGPAPAWPPRRRPR